MKYPHLAKMAKAALVVPHANVDVEMAFSVNSQTVVTPARSKLNEDTINSLTLMKDMVIFPNPEQMRSEKIPVNYNILSGWCQIGLCLFCIPENGGGREGVGRKTMKGKRRREDISSKMKARHHAWIDELDGRGMLSVN